MPNHYFLPCDQDPLSQLPDELNNASLDVMRMYAGSEMLDNRQYLFRMLRFSRTKVSKRDRERS